MKKGRNQGEDGEAAALWRHVTGSVRPYSASRSPEARPKGAKPRKTTGAALPVSSRSAVSVSREAPRRKTPLQGRIDLHGMTQAEAFDALCGFITSSVAARKKTLLVITGKGPKSDGVLRRMLPLWLENPRLKKHVRAIMPAEPKDGGAGAFYVTLRTAAQ